MVLFLKRFLRKKVKDIYLTIELHRLIFMMNKKERAYQEILNNHG